MPTYDYWCEKCDTKTEVFHGINETPEVKCPKCESLMKRIISQGIDFIMRKDGTRHSVQKYKKTSITPTPSESAAAKADAAQAEKVHNDNMAKDPYYKFRNI